MIKFNKSPDRGLKQFLKLASKHFLTQIPSLDVFENHWADSNSVKEVNLHISIQI